MNEYKIKLGSITNGKNSFSFEIKDQFFNAFTLSDVEYAEIIATALINPSAGIAHGFDSHVVTLEPNWKDRKSFWRINGIILSESDPLTIKCTGGLIQKVPSHEIHFIQPSRNSLMLSAHQLGMSEQDVADVVAFLKKY